MNVYSFLNIGKKVGSILNFIEDDRGRIQFQEAARVAPGAGLDIRKFQGNIAVAFSQEVPEQGCFPRLARSGKHHHRKLPCRP
jgi:hypothetical protein